MVGVTGFEPAAPASRTQCSTRLSYTPHRAGQRVRARLTQALQQGKRAPACGDVALRTTLHRSRPITAAPGFSAGTSLALGAARSGATEAPKEVDMRRMAKAVAAGLLCGLVVAGTGRG